MKYIKIFESFSKDKEFINKYIHSSNLVTSDEVIEVISLLEKNSSKFLNELKSKKQTPIFRGTKFPTGNIKRLKVDKNRVPKDLDMVTNNTFNDLFRAYYGVPIRKEGIFATKSPYVTHTYGTTYMFFPIGDYRYFWNPDVDDLYSFVDENSSAFNIYDDEDNDDAWEDYQESFIEETARGYKEGDIESVNNQEITFTCDEYYLVDTKYYKYICDYLNV